MDGYYNYVKEFSDLGKSLMENTSLEEFTLNLSANLI